MDFETLRKKIEAALADRPRKVVERGGLVPAAVLLLLRNRGGPRVVFAKRTERVAHHRGQIAFPGGIVETSDGSRLEAALREAEEEIGLPASAVEILGTLDDTETRATRFVITPFVGVIRKPVRYRPDGKEIERVLEMPLDALLDPANFRVEIWERNDHTSPVYFYKYRGVTIWGATARILKQFLDLV
ncbi:MAG: CoA pyrophosphatase, partial [Candidatus Rokubacteria bacterium]|nr:CoA pyrophosphatase [Candidatus Rokubacteria bacterium]